MNDHAPGEERTPATADRSDPTRQHGPLQPLQADALATSPEQAASTLLGSLLLDAPRPQDANTVVRIVEVEAYGPNDPASHAFRGWTPRRASIFAAPGTVYVYRSYGVHWCMNVAVHRDGVGAAVLLRAAMVLEGWPQIRERRPRVTDAALLRGPGCLTLGLGITDELDGSSLVDGSGSWRLMQDGFEGTYREGPRVGVSDAADVPWRFFLPNRPEVSRYRRSPRAPAPRDLST